jgi:lysophospholipase L1-like esterase
MRSTTFLAGAAAAALAFTLLASAAMAATGSAQAPTGARPSLVALGDSITFGYGLQPGSSRPSKEAFPYLIGKADGYAVTDLGVPGWTSGDLLKALATAPFQRALAGAAAVTIDIGSNDILQPALRDGLLQPGDLNPTVTAADAAQFAAAIAQFGVNLPKILTAVKELAPHAKIALYNLYDPIPSYATHLHAIAQALIGAENDIILAAAARFHVPLANANGAIAGKQSTDIIPGNVHPTVAGQAVLARAGEGALLPRSLPAEGKGMFLFNLLSLLGFKPDPAGASPYVDVPTRSFLWGYVHTAINLGIASPASATRFGINQAVTDRQAATMAARLAEADGVLQGSGAVAASTEWALHADLFRAYAPWRVVSLAQELGFVTRLKTVLKPVAAAALPSSWRLSAAQATALTQALATSVQPEYQQVGGMVSFGVNLGANKSITAQIGAETGVSNLTHVLQHLLQVSFRESEEDIAGRTHLYLVVGPVSTTDRTEGSSPLQVSGLPRTKTEVFIRDGKAYVNTGSGWRRIPAALAPQLAVVVPLFAQPVLTSLGMFQDVTGQSAPDGYVFSGRLDLAGVSPSLWRDILISLGGGKIMSAALPTPVLQRELVHSHADFTLVVERIGGIYRVTGEVMRFLLPSSPLDLSASVLEQALPRLGTLELTDKLTFSYRIVPVVAPIESLGRA